MIKTGQKQSKNNAKGQNMAAGKKSGPDAWRNAEATRQGKVKAVAKAAGKAAAKSPANGKKPAPAAGAQPGAATGDDIVVIALSLPPVKLSDSMASYFRKCKEKLGFVPNVLKAYAFDMAKLEAFVGMYNELMLGPSGLSKAEREMIAVAVSSQNAAIIVWSRMARRCGNIPATRCSAN